MPDFNMPRAMRKFVENEKLRLLHCRISLASDVSVRQFLKGDFEITTVNKSKKIFTTDSPAATIKCLLYLKAKDIRVPNSAFTSIIYSIDDTLALCSISGQLTSDELDALQKILSEDSHER